MAAWHEFRSAERELAAAGRDLLYPRGAGLAFLATVRPDGGPRLHPMWPLLTEDDLFAFIIPSPKPQSVAITACAAVTSRCVRARGRAGQRR